MTLTQLTLKDLKERVENLIKEQGEDAPMSAWIYTSEDVIKYDDNGDEVRQSDEVCDQVLYNLQDYDHIYEAIGDAISIELGECV
jgi:hypothetical protein